MIKIRMANNHDVLEIFSLLDQLGYTPNFENFQKHFKTFIKQDGYGIAIAEYNRLIVGWVAWSKSILLVTNKVRIHIEGLVVDREHRGLEIGKKLMKFVENIVITQSPCIIDLTSGLRRAKDGTHEFYKALGYLNTGEMAKLYLRKEL